MASDDIAIIGIDGRYPQSNDLTEFWNNLISGKDCISEIPDNRWNWQDYFDVNKDAANKTYSKWGGLSFWS
jgi:acyl transferase domain-containing protein